MYSEDDTCNEKENYEWKSGRHPFRYRWNIMFEFTLQKLISVHHSHGEWQSTPRIGMVIHSVRSESVLVYLSSSLSKEIHLRKSERSRNRWYKSEIFEGYKNVRYLKEICIWPCFYWSNNGLPSRWMSHYWRLTKVFIRRNNE